MANKHSETLRVYSVPKAKRDRTYSGAPRALIVELNAARNAWSVAGAPTIGPIAARYIAARDAARVSVGMTPMGAF